MVSGWKVALRSVSFSKLVMKPLKFEREPFIKSTAIFQDYSNKVSALYVNKISQGKIEGDREQSSIDNFPCIFLVL